MVLPSATTWDARPSNSLLGHPAGSLVLRVCNTELAGRQFRVSAAKISLGSAASCVVQLPELEPFHCLVVRGERQVVVRRWAAQGLLNGFPFRDAPLTTGDRLSLGPYELEVVALGGEYSPDQRVEQLLEQLEFLRGELAEAEALRERFDHAEIERQRERQAMQRLSLEFEQVAEERIRLKSQAEAKTAGYDEQARQLQQLRVELDQAQAELTARDSQLEATSAQVSELAGRLAELQVELTQTGHELVDRDQQLEAATAAYDQQAHSLAELQVELTRAGDRLADCEQQLATRQQRIEELQDAQRELQAAQREALAEQRAAAERQEVVWEQKFTELQAEAAARTAEPAPVPRDEDDPRQQAWQREREQFEADHQELLNRQRELQQQMRELAEERGSLTADLESLKERCAELEELLGDAQSALTAKSQFAGELETAAHPGGLADPNDHDHSSALESRLDALARSRSRREPEPLEKRLDEEPLGEDAYRAEASALETDDAASAAPLTWSSLRDDTLFADDDSHDEELVVGEAVPSSESSASGSYDESEESAEAVDVLDRLRQAGVWRQDNTTWQDLAVPGDEEPDAEEPDASTDVDSEASLRNRFGRLLPESSAEVEESPSLLRKPLTQDAESGDDERPTEDNDEAIQNYMNRLLLRVRGQRDDVESPAEARPVAKKQDSLRSAPQVAQAAKKPEPESPSDVSHELVRAEDYVPRSSAPEKNLQAMRELANSSAKSALNTYDRKRGKESARSHLTYAAGCFFAGLASFLLVRGASPVVGWIGTGCGFGMACILSIVGLLNATRLQGPEETAAK